MTGRDLRASRVKLCGDRRGAVKRMAERLETPTRTYQRWEARKGLIPGIASVAVKGILELQEISLADPESAQD